MIIVKALEVHNYKAVKEAYIRDIRDLNIFIGPNNCGKTSILDTLKLVSNIGSGGNILCAQCGSLAKDAQLNGISLTIDPNDAYLRENNEVEISLSFDEQGIDNIAPGILNEIRSRLKSNCGHGSMDEIRFKGKKALHLVHITPFCTPDITEKLAGQVIYCTDRRLETYQGREHAEYIGEKNLRTTKLTKWIESLRATIDSKIVDCNQRTLHIIRDLEGKEFTAKLSEQGSGIRSLAGVLADLEAADSSRIILIDEPELGLNPINKQEILKLLLHQAEKKQVFLATHDPTFVNPVLWESERVAVFAYSPFKGQFVKVNLSENKEDPEVFGGYLPHTTSLKNIHIYVEGSSDVYILQVFLRKFLKKKDEEWTKSLNRVGIFHLGGDFWTHLLHTIPKSPYKSIVILDGDKKDEARKVCEKYNGIKENIPRFEFGATLDRVKSIMEKEGVPIYCLELACIEEYLKPKPEYKKEGYLKAIDGPTRAENMDEVPKEIEKIFDVIL